MARIRSIKPEFWTSGQIMDCQPLTRLMFIGTWNFCDDAGNHPAEPRRIKAQLFPGDDTVTSKSVLGMLQELSANALISFYDGPDGLKYFHVTGWQKHQRIDKPQKPRFPPYPHSTNCPGIVAEHSRTAPEPFATDVDKGKEGSKNQKTPTPPEYRTREPDQSLGVVKQVDNRGSKLKTELDPAWVDLQRELVALYDERGIIGTPNTETCREWKALGLDPEMCYAVVAGKLIGADFKPLAYFTKAIQRAQAEKANVVPIKPPVAINWDFVFRTYVENRNCRRWEASYFCPPPPSPQCIAPAEMFIKYDIDPKTGYFTGYSRTTDKLIEPKGLPANSPGPAKVTG